MTLTSRSGLLLRLAVAVAVELRLALGDDALKDPLLDVDGRRRPLHAAQTARELGLLERVIFVVVTVVRSGH